MDIKKTVDPIAAFRNAIDPPATTLLGKAARNAEIIATLAVKAAARLRVF